MEKEITFIACPNGLGHFKRSLSVADALRKEFNGTIRIVATKEQIERKHFWRFNNLNNKPVEFVETSMPKDLGWQPKASDYDFERYSNWLEEIASNAFMDSDVLVSDNLVAVLNYRSDSLLTGSFLWPDVLAGLARSSDEAKELKQIIQFEESLLRLNSPDINCIADIYMPYLNSHCSVNPVGWFTSSSAAVKPLSSTPKVLFSIGATGASMSRFENALGKLPKSLTLYGDEKISKQMDRVNRFSFEEEDFRSLDAIICRPGIGILTEAITYGVPVLMLYESDNSEMVHNAAKAEDLGLGVALNLNDTEKLTTTLEDLLEHKTDYNYAASAEINGADSCARAILKNI